MVVADADDLGADDLRRLDRVRPKFRRRSVYLHFVLAPNLSVCSVHSGTIETMWPRGEVGRVTSLRKS